LAFDRTLVQIRERSFLDLLDLALVVIRTRPLALGAAAAVGIAPFAALNAWLIRDREVSSVLLVYLLVLETPWATAPLTVVLGGLMFGERPSPGRIIKTLARGFVPMVWYQVFVRGFLLMTFIFYPVVPARLAFLDEVILLEREPFWKVRRRCSQLTDQRGGDLFRQWWAQIVFGTLFAFAFWAGTGALIQALITSEITWEPNVTAFIDARFQVAIWVAIAFFGVARFFIYIDQRIRLEGWEVELRLRAVGRAMEDASRW
jgi:hypothetical protein